MWARVVEIMLALWLAVSPFVFHFPPEATLLWANDFSCAVLIATLAFLSLAKRWRHIHLLSIAVGTWLIAFAYSAGLPAPFWAQNDIIVGLLIVMFAIIPSDATEPPPSWREVEHAEQLGRLLP